MALNPNVKWPAQTNAPTAAYTYGSAQNVTTPGDGTGTPFEEDLVNDWFGFQQELLDKAGITPSGNPDEVDDSDIYNAIRLTSGYPGLIVPMALNVDPATLGLRILKMVGQVIAIANYPDLVAATYVGDADNPDAQATAFIKTSDAGGAVKDTTGGYFVLPDARGRFVRGLDPAGTRDPDGAIRIMGNNQVDAYENHSHRLCLSTVAPASTDFSTRDAADPGAGAAVKVLLFNNDSEPIYAYDELSGTTPETRPHNICCDFGIWY